MAERKQGMAIPTFSKHKDVDIAFDRSRTSQEERLINKKINKRSDKITIGVHGKTAKCYILKEWKIYKGKGS